MQELQTQDGNVNEIFNVPPVITESELPNELSFFANHEVTLIIVILIFGLICLFGLYRMSLAKLLDQEKFTTLAVVVIVVVAVLFMLIAGFSSERTTPLIALLATIIGYVLGTKSNKE